VDDDKQTALRIENLGLNFGGVQALFEVIVDLSENKILAIIGPNRASGGWGT
jgi:ABC-type branched-subunit amino acid transport system ATPase component